MCLWKDLAMTLHLWWRSGQFYSLLISQPSCHIRRKKKNRCIVQPLSFPSFLHSARLRYPRCCLKATWKPWWMIWPSCPSTGRPFLRITRLTWSDLGIQISRAVLGAPYIEPRWNQAFWIWTPTNKYYDVSWCFFKGLLAPSGDEIDALGDNFMFLVWSSDSSPYLSNSASSRFPICVLPASRYVISETGVNLSLQVVTKEIVKSFNYLSRSGIKIRNLDPRNPQTAPSPKYKMFDLYWLHMREIDLNKYGFAIRKLLKPTKAAVLRCYVAGYRGDWKALSQVFAFERFYNKNEATVLGERMPQKT